MRTNKIITGIAGIVTFFYSALYPIQKTYSETPKNYKELVKKLPQNWEFNKTEIENHRGVYTIWDNNRINHQYTAVLLENKDNQKAWVIMDENGNLVTNKDLYKGLTLNATIQYADDCVDLENLLEELISIYKKALISEVIVDVAEFGLEKLSVLEGKILGAKFKSFILDDSQIYITYDSENESLDSIKTIDPDELNKIFEEGGIFPKTFSESELLEKIVEEEDDIIEDATKEIVGGILSEFIFKLEAKKGTKIKTPLELATAIKEAITESPYYGLKESLNDLEEALSLLKKEQLTISEAEEIYTKWKNGQTQGLARIKLWLDLKEIKSFSDAAKKILVNFGEGFSGMPLEFIIKEFGSENLKELVLVEPNIARAYRNMEEEIRTQTEFFSNIENMFKVAVGTDAFSFLNELEKRKEGKRLRFVDASNFKILDVRVLTNGSKPKFSPDGKSIAYIHERQTMNSSDEQIIIMNSDGTNKVMLANSFIKPPYTIEDFEWSENGEKILYWYFYKGDPHSMYVIDRFGSVNKHVANRAYDGHWYNEKFIVYANFKKDNRGSEIYSYDLETGEESHLVGVLFRRFLLPKISPDDKFLAYVVDGELLKEPVKISEDMAVVFGSEEIENDKLYLIDIKEGIKIEKLEVETMSEGGSSNFGLAAAGLCDIEWSPDSKKIAYQVDLPGETHEKIRYGSVYIGGELFVLDLETEKGIKVSDHGKNFNWSSDSKRLTFDKSGDIFVADFENGNVYPLTNDSIRVYDKNPYFDPKNNNKLIYESDGRIISIEFNLF